MKKRVLIACLFMVLVSLLIAALGNSIENRFRNTINAAVTIDGKTIDLSGTEVEYGIFILHSELPMGCYTTAALAERKNKFSAEFKAMEYWNFYFEFVLPAEKIGLGEDIIIKVGEDDTKAWENSIYDVTVDISKISETEADIALNLVRSHADKNGKIVTEERSFEKRVDENDALVESIIRCNYFINNF